MESAHPVVEQSSQRLHGHSAVRGRLSGVIPAGGLDSDAEPQWSWGIQLLPYLEQQSRYQRIDFSQAWNSERNKKDLSEEIRVFLNPSESDRTPVDGFAITHQTANSRLRPSWRGLA